ncbi:MAG TPA: YhdH/YhfP family quinone oxidoreductase [Pirellulales bacterium]|jgi:putative YhdH/YhfP family quinone oxidoreductase|nr:YhdH/YhfP family quinone oxidoreductase [Pirellulales bacterium]
MLTETFSAYVVTKDEAGQVQGGVRSVSQADLPPGDVLIQVAYSSLNYKDALAARGNPGVVKKLPHVPGIDAVGTVIETTSNEFAVGEEVLVTSYELGAARWGGFAELVRVPADWVVRLPAGLSPREAMLLGTAGFTAAQSVDTLLSHGVRPEQGEIVVTGATGGVGSWAIALLRQLGFRVAAVSGKPDAEAYLRALGAQALLAREDVDDRGAQPLLKGRWAGAVDSVGGNILATILRGTMAGGCVTACGLTGGTNLPLTVFPFILRGVTLAGIDSAWTPHARRVQLWNQLAGPWKTDQFNRIQKATIGLSEVNRAVEEMLAGAHRGRTLIEIRPDRVSATR